MATNCLTGEAEYFEKGHCTNIFHAIRASASMPYISKMVDIDGKPYLDGGCSCKIPYQWAIDQGFEKIVVIKTRHADYRKNLKKASEVPTYPPEKPQGNAWCKLLWFVVLVFGMFSRRLPG